MLDKKRTAFYLLTFLLPLIVVLICFELWSYYFIVISNHNFYLPLELEKVNTHEIKERYSRQFIYDLGWEPEYFTSSLGYRGADKDLNNAFISLFGDSYTQGHPDIEKSWPFLLEKKLGKPVLNFGVGGYGTDQAFWRFEKLYVGNLKTPYVALGIMSENIARIVNRYRGFYQRGHNINRTKPMYYKEEDEDIVMLPNPLKSSDDIRLLHNEKFLRGVGEKDYWFRHFEKYDMNHKVHFPYSYFLLKALPYYLHDYYQKRTTNYANYKTLYDDKSATSIMKYIVSAFITRAKENNTFPIILFMPNENDLVDYQQKGKTVYNKFFLYVKSQHDATFDALAYFLPYMERGQAISLFFDSMRVGHYNPYGEQVLSEGFYHDLRDLTAE